MADQLPEVIIQTAQQAAKATFTTICGAEPVYHPNAQPRSDCAGLVSVVSFAGDWAWWLALVFPAETAQELGRKFTGSTIPYNSPFMDSVVSELANVLGGEVVAQLDVKGAKAQMSLPSVARGNDVEALIPNTGAPPQRFFFSTQQGTFWLQMAMTPSGQLLGRKPGT